VKRPWRRDERPVLSVPAGVFAALGAAVLLHAATQVMRPPARAEATDLEAPPSLATLRVVAAGEPIGLAQALTLWLQAFDNQPGVSIPFARLDYDRVIAWLDRILGLDPLGQYPLLMASHLYAQVSGHPEKSRVMADFVLARFLEDPDRRWPWLAHMAIMAKHRLKDLPLAIRYADAIRDHVRSPSVPSWARQMHIFFREDMGEYEAAKVLLGGLLASGTVTDSHEIRFLTERLEALRRAGESPPADP
jgi:hypothetical protein